MMKTEKKCSKCGEIKPVSEFYRRKSAKDGLDSWCKACYREDHQRHYREHREEILERVKNYYHENSEEKKDYAKDYYRKNKDKIDKVHQRWCVDNPEKKKGYGRKCYRKHAVRYRAADRTRKATQRGRELNRHYQAKRNAKKRGLPGSYTQAQWDKLCTFFNECPCCNEPCDSFTIDHIIPLTWEDATNFITNIQPLCRVCNSGKGNWHATDYRPERVRAWAKGELKFP